MSKYVGLVQQGMVTDQRVVSTGASQSGVESKAKAEADRLNAEETGFGEGWTAVALKVPA